MIGWRGFKFEWLTIEHLSRPVLIEAQYLAPLTYFALLHNSDQIIIERHEHYVKQSYRNRCYINGANGKEMLVVPTSKHNHTPITEVKIDYNQKWLNRHWRAVQSAYGKAPFFEFYAQDLEQILFKNYRFLYDLNLAFLSMCLNWLRWDLPLRESEKYEKEILPPKIDRRNVISPKNELEKPKYYKPVIYPQVFGSTFVPYLSLLDLMFCKGPDANLILQEMALIE